MRDYRLKHSPQACKEEKNSRRGRSKAQKYINLPGKKTSCAKSTSEICNKCKIEVTYYPKINKWATKTKTEVRIFHQPMMWLLSWEPLICSTTWLTPALLYCSMLSTVPNATFLPCRWLDIFTWKWEGITSDVVQLWTLGNASLSLAEYRKCQDFGTLFTLQLTVMVFFWNNPHLLARSSELAAKRETVMLWITFRRFWQ